MKRTWSQANADEFGQLGIILSVKLQNFMCHDNLSFDFDPHINFIIGCNGSGKSAVLTGIILALGGKSSSTGRFCNIKGFVKTGKNTASVSVTLKNCGPDAFKPDVYGEKITIERHFTLEGSNTYKLKSETGKLISNSKEELITILNVMDIEVENPVTVLVQDTSKNFLVSKTAKGDKLFKLFYEGTGLSKVYEDYNRALQQSKEAKSDLADKKNVILGMEKEVNALKSLLNKSFEINELTKEFVWSVVKKFEKDRDAKLPGLEETRNSVTDLTQKINQNDEEIADISQKVVTAESERKTSERNMDDLRRSIQNKHSEKSTLNSEIREIEGTLNRLNRELQRLGSMITSLEEQINQARVQNTRNFDAEKIRHQRMAEELEKIRTSITVGNKSKTDLNEKIEKQQNEINFCVAEIQELVNEKKRIEREKLQIICGMKNRLNAFGTEMEAVIQDIRNGVAAGIFKVQPVGPIGQYIDVKKPEWNFAIEECLKLSLLKSFVCDNNEDGEQLSNIFSKHYVRQRPPIIISKFDSQVYDVRAHKCVCKYPTLLDMLHISVPMVANCLIDQKQIENILLVDSSTEARNLMLHNPPAKCIYAISHNGDQNYHSPIRKYSCRNKGRLCILKSFQKDDLEKKEEELKIIDIKISEKKNLKDRLLHDLNLMEEEFKSRSDQVMQMKFAELTLKTEIDSEESSFIMLKDVNILQADWDKCKMEKDDHERKIVSCQAVLNEKSSKFRNLDNQLAEFTRTLEKEYKNFSQLSKDVEEYQSQKEKKDLLFKKMKPLLTKLKEDLKEKEEAVAKIKSDIKVSTIQAQNKCQRIETDRSPDTIRRLIKETKLHFEEKNIDAETIDNQCKKQVEEYNKSKRELRKHEKINDRIISMINERFQEFKKICKNTSVALNCAFITLLKDNKFNGFLNINFETKTLDIFAKPESSKSKFGSKPNLSQLSGGERSYVTISFLLALWDRIHSPFRILDEYDVFMDSNNRHRSIDLLINNARSNKKVQYIFYSV